jgi:hypothetical protein
MWSSWEMARRGPGLRLPLGANERTKSATSDGPANAELAGPARNDRSAAGRIIPSEARNLAGHDRTRTSAGCGRGSAT